MHLLSPDLHRPLLFLPAQLIMELLREQKALSTLRSIDFGVTVHVRWGFKARPV